MLTKQIIQQTNINNALSQIPKKNLDPDDDHVRKKNVKNVKNVFVLLDDPINKFLTSKKMSG
jgi:hypothetical protein